MLEGGPSAGRRDARLESGDGALSEVAEGFGSDRPGCTELAAGVCGVREGAAADDVTRCVCTAWSRHAAVVTAAGAAGAGAGANAGVRATEGVGANMGSAPLFPGDLSTDVRG